MPREGHVFIVSLRKESREKIIFLLGMNDLSRACMRCVRNKCRLCFFVFFGGVRPIDS